MQSLISKLSRMRFDLKGKLSIQGLTLLELMIAMTILTMIWGCVGSVMVKISHRMKEMMRDTGSISKIEKDMERNIYSPWNTLKGSQSELKFHSSTVEIDYIFKNQNLYRCTIDSLKRHKSEEEIGKNIQSCTWMFLSKGVWHLEWNEDQMPEAVLCQLSRDQKTIQIMYPMRVRKLG